MPKQQWFEKCPERLGLEWKAVRERFPVMSFRKLQDGTMCLDGQLRSASRKKYRVVLVYPADYPQTAPAVYPVPRMSGPHQYGDGALCLFRPDDRTWTSESTAAMILAIAALWLSVYEYWQKHGVWLGREHVGA